MAHEFLLNQFIEVDSLFRFQLNALSEESFLSIMLDLNFDAEIKKINNITAQCQV